MKMHQFLPIIPAAILLAAVHGFAQGGRVSKSITVTTDPKGGVTIVTNGSSASVSVTTNGHATAVSVGTDPVVITSSGSGLNVDDVMKQVEEAMRQAMGGTGAVKDAMKQATQQMQSALANANAQGQRPTRSGGGGARATSGVKLWGSSTPEPAIITTAPMDSAARAEWLEDLKVMNKLLRDEIDRVEGASPRHAMGIRVFLSSHDAEQPMYLDGHGAVFNLGTEVALAASGKKTEPKEERKTSSAWDNARKQVNSSTYSNDNVRVWVHSAQTAFSNFDKPAREFDAARLEELTDAVTGILGEAKNIRQLKKGETVTVTLGGHNDAGDPARYTFKVKKEDIDQFTAGKLTAAEFKKKIAKQVN
jgi:Sec-independent protein translocase protein TatA